MWETQKPPAEGAGVRDRLPPYNLEAEFLDIRFAGLAFEALGKAGIEGDSISVTGSAADHAAEPSDAKL